MKKTQKPPQNKPEKPDMTLELSVLATILRFPDKIELASHYLSSAWPDHWQEPRLAIIADIVINLHNTGKKADSVTISRLLKKKNQTAALKFLPELLENAESTEVLENRAIELAEQTHSRLLKKSLEKNLSSIAHGIDNLPAFYAQIRKDLDSVYGGKVKAISPKSSAEKVMEAYYTQKRNPGPTGVLTGIKKLDDTLLGLQYGTLTLLGARPSHGKTAISNQFGLNAAGKGFPVLYFSHEMTAQQLTQRMACNIAGTSLTIAQSGNFSLHTEQRFIEALKMISNLPITFVDETMVQPQDCINYMRYMRQKWGRPGLVIVDYIQLEHLKNYQGTRNDEIAEISAMWLAGLKETSNASLFLAQLKRDASARKPKLSDLRDCGALEQDAHAALLWYREGMDDPTKPANKGELNLAKNRNGSLCSIDLYFQGFCQRFREWESHDKPLNREEQFLEEKTDAAKQHKDFRYENPES